MSSNKVAVNTGKSIRSKRIFNNSAYYASQLY